MQRHAVSEAFQARKVPAVHSGGAGVVSGRVVVVSGVEVEPEVGVEVVNSSSGDVLVVVAVCGAVEMVGVGSGVVLLLVVGSGVLLLVESPVVSVSPLAVAGAVAGVVASDSDSSVVSTLVSAEVVVGGEVVEVVSGTAVVATGGGALLVVTSFGEVEAAGVAVVVSESETGAVEVEVATVETTAAAVTTVASGRSCKLVLKAHGFWHYSTLLGPHQES